MKRYFLLLACAVPLAAGTPAGIAKVGIFRSGFEWLLDANGNRGWDGPPGDFLYEYGGIAGDIPVVGDWNGSGTSKVGIYRSSNGKFLLDANGNGVFDTGDFVYNFLSSIGGPQSGDMPVVGDWNGSGTTKVGIFRAGFEWILDTNGDGVFDTGDTVYDFGGITGDIPVVGDWSGSGTSKVGIFRDRYQWLLDYNGNGTWDSTPEDVLYDFGGITGDIPVVGDWSGSGTSKVGIFRDGYYWILDYDGNGVFDDPPDLAFAFGGVSGDQPVVGNWQNNFAPLQSPPPTSWNSINYFPLGYSFDQMLWNWSTCEQLNANGMCVKAVSDAVQADLAILRANNFNVLHLYLWDRQSLEDVTAGADFHGFCSAPDANEPVCSSNDPSTSSDMSGTPGSLWNNLDMFLTDAANNSLYVILEFVNYTLRDQLAAGANCMSVQSDYQTWMKTFVDHFEAGHNNILAWGLGYGFAPNQGTGSCNDTTWANSYTFLKCEIGTVLTGSCTPTPIPPTDNVIVGITFGAVNTSLNPSQFPIGIIPRGSGYSYNWSCDTTADHGSLCVSPTAIPNPPDVIGSQQMYYHMSTLLGAAPDYVELTGYNSNSGDMYAALVDLGTTYGITEATAVPASKMFFSEFGISTGVTETFPPSWYEAHGNATGPGDNQVPITTRAGQSQWVQNTVCAYKAAGVTKQAYWNMYDPYAYYASLQTTGGALSYDAYFGLVDINGVHKPAWSTLTSYYAGGLSCPAPSAATPVLSINVDSPSLYYTINQPPELYWMVTDETSLSLSPNSYSSVRSCLASDPVFASSTPDGSCAYAVLNPFSSAGSQTVSMTASNGSVTPVTQSVTFTVGLMPIINGITSDAAGAACDTSNLGSDSVTTTSTLLICGQGFAARGGNIVWLQNTSNGLNYYLCNTADPGYTFNPAICTSNSSFHDQSVYQIFAPLIGVPAGSYVVYVQNSYTTAWSGFYSLTIS